jgi:hypothetical protein
MSKQHVLKRMRRTQRAYALSARSKREHMLGNHRRAYRLLKWTIRLAAYAQWEGK